MYLMIRAVHCWLPFCKSLAILNRAQKLNGVSNNYLIPMKCTLNLDLRMRMGKRLGRYNHLIVRIKEIDASTN